jgi:hypothetical protein
MHLFWVLGLGLGLEKDSAFRAGEFFDCCMRYHLSSFFYILRMDHGVVFL